MLIDGHEIRSDLGRARLWDELVSLETIADWSALDACASPEGDRLTAGTSFICTHSNGRLESDAGVTVIDFEPGSRLGLRTVTAVADLEEHLVLTDDGDGSLLTYSADATSAGFGPSATIWLRLHVNHVCGKLEAFARRQLV